MLLALFVACSKPEPEPVIAEPEPLPFEFDENLQNIDTLLQSDATTALQELLSSDTLPVISTEAERSGDPSKARAFTSSEKISAIFNENYHQLLLSEALYKTDNPQYYRNELQAAMRFFDSLAVLYPTNDYLTVLSARSHYMNGVGFYENDSIVEACKEYLHTLEIMENHFNVETLRGYRAKFMGLTYNRLKELFTSQFMVEPAIYCGKKSLYYCKIAPTSKYGVSNNLAKLGKLYDISDQADSAYYYYNEGLKALPDTNNSMYRDLVSSLALLSYKLGYGLQPSLEQLFMVVDQTDDEKEKVTRFFTIGGLYYLENMYDSAVKYLYPVFENDENVIRKQQAADYLMNIYQKSNDTIKLSKYSIFLAQNTISKYDESLNESVLSELFHNYLSKKQTELQNEHLKNIKKHNWIIITCSSVTFVIIIILIVLISKKTRAIKKKSHDELEEKDKALAEMKRKMEANPFVKEPICKYILKVVNENSFKAKLDFRAYKNFALDRNQIMMLRDAVDRHYNSFTQLLSKTYPELTFDDLDYCCLYLLGLKEADIAALMQRAYPTVCQRSRKIKRIFNTKESLQSAIAAMAFQAQCNA